MIVPHALYLIAPALAAGIAHALMLKSNALPVLAVPIDRGRQFRGAPLFGENKTWRGPIVMVAVSTGIAALIGLSPLLGACLGCAYSVAELPNSFVKRRLGISPGARSFRHAATQYVADQGDSALGCSLALLLFVHDPALLATVFALGLALHAAIDALLYVFGVKQRQVVTA
jgi:hypothetical protein